MLPTPHYLIHIPPDPHPHHTTLAFLASVYTSWSHRVNTLPPSSLYVKQRPKKDHHKLLCRRPRPSLLLLCALEVVRRGEEDAGGRDTVQSVMGDSTRGLVEGGESLFSSTLVYMFTRIYMYIYISLSNPPSSPSTPPSCLTCPRRRTPRTHPRLGFYDEGQKVEAMAFDIEPHYARRREQIWGAVRYAVGKGEGRMGEVGKKRGRRKDRRGMRGWRGRGAAGV